MEAQEVVLPKLNKRAFLITLLKRNDGASLQELADATEWKVNSIRGAISLLEKTNKQLTFTSEKRDGIRFYKATTSQPDINAE